MNQISLSPYMQQMAIQPQVFYVIERNELFQLFKEWFSKHSDKEDLLEQPVSSGNSDNPMLSPLSMPFTNPSPLTPPSRNTSNPPTMMPDGYYSREEVSQMLQVDKSTLWRWDKTGVLKSVKLGPRKVGYLKDDVKKFIDNRNQNG